jgi:hypothetical protein
MLSWGNTIMFCLSISILCVITAGHFTTSMSTPPPPTFLRKIHSSVTIDENSTSFFLSLSSGQPVKSNGATDRAVPDQQCPEGKSGSIPGLLEPGGIQIALARPTSHLDLFNFHHLFGVEEVNKREDLFFCG